MKLCGKPTYRGLTAEQVLTGWFFYYDDWKREPCIRVKSADVRRLLGIGGHYASLQDFFGPDGYRLDAEALADASMADAKAVGEANEKFSLVSSVATGALWKIFPYTSPSSADASRLEWLSLADRLPRDMPLEEGTFVRGAMNYVAEQVARKDFAEASRWRARILPRWSGWWARYAATSSVRVGCCCPLTSALVPSGSITR